MEKDLRDIKKYISEIGKRLKNPNMYGAASLMVGAGFSKNAERLNDDSRELPNWEELAKEMYDELYPENTDHDKKVEECSGKNILTLAQKYEVSFDKKSLNSFIERKIDDEAYKPGELHRKILELKWDDIFTTNYDTLLERAIGMASTRRGYRIIRSQEDLPGSTRPRIIKLHGSVGYSDDFVITDEDYRKYPDSFAPFVNTVQQSMLETRLCLLGFSGNDPNFLSWLGWLRDNMGENCPSIYLFGVFDDMSLSEKKMLEGKNIIVIDLSELADENSNNKNYEAINRFLDYLKKESAERNNSIVFNKPYSDIIPFDKKTEEDLVEYEQVMKVTVEGIIEKIERYICVPQEESRIIRNYIIEQLKFILNQDYFNGKYVLVGKYCYILQKCNHPLLDYIASKLFTILDDERCNKEERINIALYLLQMCRLDGKLEEYEKICDDCEKIIDEESSNTRNEYYIEKTKYYISMLEPKKAIDSVLNIGEASTIKCSLKKSALMNQLGMEMEAKEILKSSMAILAQQRLEDDIKASFVGYINLIYRSMSTYWGHPDLFSDIEYISNKFNSRVILEKVKGSFQKTVFERKNKEKETVYSFNPNSYITRYNISSSESDGYVFEAFEFLLMQDMMCVGIYHDYKLTIERTIKAIENTSESPLWKWYYILKTNDINIYDRFFTREKIYSTKIEFVKRFYDSIIVLFDYYLQDIDRNNLSPFKRESLLDVASRLTIVLDEKRVIKLISLLVQIDEKVKNSDFILNKTKRIVLDRLKYSCNKRIIEPCLEYIKDDKLSDYGLIQSFGGLNISNSDISNKKILNDIIEMIANDLMSDDVSVRDNAVLKYDLFVGAIEESDYKEEILNNLWNKKDQYGFPLNNVFLPTAWENDERFKKGIVKYLTIPNIAKKIQGNGIMSDNNSFNEIQNYFSVFYRTIVRFSNTCFLTEDELSDIVKYFVEYIDNEKELLDDNYRIFFSSKSVINCFETINNIILLVCTNAITNGIFGELLKKRVREYLEQNKKIKLDSGIIKEIIEETNPIYLFDCIEKNIKIGGKDSIASSLFSIYSLQEIFKNTDKKDAIDERVLKFISSLDYLDLEMSKKIIFNIMIIVRNELFLVEENKELLINALSNCYDLYTKDKNDITKVKTDGMYSVSNTLKLYSDYLDNNNTKRGDSFDRLVEVLKENKLNEVRKEWRECLD